MSRLFGLITKEKVDVSFLLLKEGVARDKVLLKIKSGFGLGWYEDMSVKTVKLPLPVEGGKEFWQIGETIHSNIIIFHIREKTVGEERKYNTHPFSYKNFMFAHIGTINNWKDLENKLTDEWRKQIKGETDSERYFMLIMQYWDDDEPERGISRAIKEVKKVSSYSSLNFLLTDGKKLYAYRSGELSLFYLKTIPEDDICCTSVSSNLAIRSRGLKGREAVIVSAEKLSHEGWELLKQDELLIVDENLKISAKIL